MPCQKSNSFTRTNQGGSQMNQPAPFATPDDPTPSPHPKP